MTWPRRSSLSALFDWVGGFGILAGKPKVAAYQQALSTRSSVRTAVATDYNVRLWTFLQARNSHLSRIIARSTKKMS
jgi:glutathione S-transferase